MMFRRSPIFFGHIKLFVSFIFENRGNKIFSFKNVYIIKIQCNDNRTIEPVSTRAHAHVHIRTQGDVFSVTNSNL